MNLMDLFIKIGVDDQASGKISTITKNIGKGIATAAAVAAAALAKLSSDSIKSFAEYEQLVGGVETLFKENANIVKQYANVAFREAGVSASQYMETVTSFSASLIQSLGGDTMKAAKIANTALVDISDNANKMGSTVESLQTVYAGLAKGQYMLLDNLKLGYGGTKEEMVRLIKRASELDESVKANDLSFSNIILAIHAVQEELGIAGATSEEAATTISGSIGMVKASFADLIRGISDDQADFEQLLNNFISSVETAGKLLLKRIGVALNGAVQFVRGLLKAIVEALPKITREVLPGLLRTIINAIVEVIQSIAQYLPEITKEVSKVLDDLSTMLAPAVVAIIMSLLTALSDPDVGGSIFATSGFILANLVDGLIMSAPDVAAAGPEIIINLVRSILRSIGSISIVGAKIVFSLINGVLNAIVKIPDAVKQLWSALKNGFFGIVEDAKNWGSDLIDNFVNGIKGGIGKIKNAVVGIADTVKEYIGFSEPEKGPLSNFHTYAPDMIDLFAQGIKENEWKLTDQIAKSFNFKPAIESGADADAAVSGTTNDINININIDGSGSAQDIASAVSYELQRLLNRRSAVYG